MFALLFAVLMAASPTVPVPMYVPRVLSDGGQVLAMAGDGSHVYAQTPSGLVAWDGKGKLRRLGSIAGEWNAGLALAEAHVFFIADGRLWKAPKVGRPGKPEVLAMSPHGMGVAAEAGTVFFTDGATSQIYRVDAVGGPVVPLVTIGVEKRTRADSPGLGQAMVVDAQRVFWVFEDRVLSVPRSGGAASEVARSPSLQPRALALDGDTLLFADGQGTFRRDKTGGVPPERILDCSASTLAVASDGYYAACGAELVRVSRDGRTRQVLDVGPSEKSGLAVLGKDVFFADDQSGTIMPSVLVLSPDGKSVEGAAGKPGFSEAVLAVRRFLGELGSKDALPSLLAPVTFRLGPDARDGWSLSTTVSDAARLGEVAAELQGREHPLLGFHTRYAWQLLSNRKLDADVSVEKKRFYKRAGNRTVLVSHRTAGGCPYSEVTVVVGRIGTNVVPTALYFEAGYDCE